MRGRHGPFSLSSLPISLAFTCVRALTPTRSRDGASGTSCNRREFGGPATRGQEKSTGGKTTEEKTDWQIRSFRANNYRINYSARSAHSRPRYSRARTHTYTMKEWPRLSISGGTWVRLIREADLTARTRVRRVTSPARTPAPSNSLLRSS